MSKKQTRTLLILLALLAVLGIVFAAVKLSAKKKEQAAAAKTAAAKQEAVVSQKVYTAFSWTRNGEKYAFTRQGNVWYWDADKAFPLNANYLTKLANTLNSLSPVQTIRDGDALRAYGLDAPAFTLTATAKDGTKNTFALGGSAVNSDGNYYLMVNGDADKLYVVDATLHDELAADVLAMMQLPDLPVLQTGDLKTLEVRGTADTRLAAQAKKSGEKTTVSWYAGEKDVTKNAAVKSLISAVSSMTVASARFYKPTAAQLSQCGLSSPAAVVTLQYTDAKGAAQTLTLSVGKAADDGENRYVRLGGDDTVYAMTASKLTALLSVAENGLSAD